MYPWGNGPQSIEQVAKETDGFSSQEEDSFWFETNLEAEKA